MGWLTMGWPNGLIIFWFGPICCPTMVRPNMLANSGPILEPTFVDFKAHHALGVLQWALDLCLKESHCFLTLDMQICE